MSFTERRVLAVGLGLAEVARAAFEGARLEVVAPDGLPDRWPAGHEPELVVLDADADPLALAQAIATLARLPGPPAAILAGANLSAGLVRALLRLPRADVVEAPFGPRDLAEAALMLLRPAEAAAPAAPTGGRCWTVVGAVGGAGATTLAVELAACLAERAPGEKRVALVDLNLADGASAAYLGASANMMLGRASQTPERIDAALLEIFASPAQGGFDLIAQARDPHGFEAVSSEAVLRVLEVACEVYDFVIVDAPRHRRAWTIDVLAGSDALLVVSELTVPALLAARSLASEFEADLPHGPGPRIILNRLAKRVFGPAPSMGEAEKALGRKADGGLTSDWEAAAASVNLGGPIRSHRPKSRIAKDVDNLVDRLLSTVPHVHAAPAPSVPIRAA